MIKKNKNRGEIKIISYSSFTLKLLFYFFFLVNNQFVYAQYKNKEYLIESNHILENNIFKEIDYSLLMVTLGKLISDNNIVSDNSSSTVNIEADYQESLGNKFIAKGNVIAVSGSAILKADKIIYDKVEKTFFVEGNVKFIKGEQFFESNKLVYNSTKDIGFLEEVYGIMDFEKFDEDLNIKNLDGEEFVDSDYETNNIREINVFRPSTLGFSRNDKRTSFSLLSESIKKWRFKSERIDFTSKTLNSKKVLFTNDVFNNPQFIFEAKNFNAFIKDKKMRFKSPSSFFILDNKLRIPVGPRNISSRDFDDVWGIGYEYENKEGYYFNQNLAPYKISDNFEIDFDIFYLANRAYNGKTNSFTAKNSSITSDKVSQDLSLFDLLALHTNVYGKLGDFDLLFKSQTNSLDLEKFARSSRAKFQLNKTFELSNIFNKKAKNDINSFDIENQNLRKSEYSNNPDQLFILEEMPQLKFIDIDTPSNLKLDFSIYATYREKINKAFSASTDLYTSYGTQFALRNVRPINNWITESSLLALDLGQYQGEKKLNKELTDLFRYGLAGKLDYGLKLINIGTSKSLTEDYYYVAKTIDQGLNLNFGITGNLFNYSDSSYQESLTVNLGPKLVLGEFKNNFLDYSMLSLNYVYVQGSASSPFKFDNIDDSFNLVLDYEQQLLGPLLYGYRAEFNIKGGSDYGKISNASYTLGLRRRAYSLQGYYKPASKTIGFNFGINNFRYKGIPPSF